MGPLPLPSLAFSVFHTRSFISPLQHAVNLLHHATSNYSKTKIKMSLHVAG